VNREQKLVLLFGAVVALAMCLYVPWDSGSYGWVHRPPAAGLSAAWHEVGITIERRIDYSRLGLQLGLVAGLSGLLVWGSADGKATAATEKQGRAGW
jgi:hypothetical protein